MNNDPKQSSPLQPHSLSRAPLTPLAQKLPSAVPHIDVNQLDSLSHDDRFVAYMAIHRTLSGKARLTFPLEGVIASVSRDCTSPDKTVRRCAIGIFHRLLRRASRFADSVVSSSGMALLCAAGHEDLAISRDALGVLCVHARRLPITFVPALISLIAERVSLIPVREASREEQRILALARSLVSRDPEATKTILEFLKSHFASAKQSVAGRATGVFCWFNDLFTNREIADLLRLPKLPPNSLLLISSNLPGSLSIPQFRFAIRRVVRILDQATKEGDQSTKEHGQFALECLASTIYSSKGLNRAIREFLAIARMTGESTTLEHAAFMICLVHQSAKGELLHSIEALRTKKVLRPALATALQIMERRAKTFTPTGEI